MSEERFSPERFWDKKIASWEEAKYNTSGLHLPGWPDWVKIDVNSSVKARQSIARNSLRPVVTGQEVVELGCGSALLAGDILRAGARRYVGIDFSSVAIAAAKSRARREGYADRVDLQCLDVGQMPAINTDICFSLGLTDWLTPGQLAAMLRLVEAKYFLHSFSERRKTPSQIAHRIYVAGSYGYKQIKYTPRYYSENQLRGQFCKAGIETLKVFRSPELSFGSFVHSSNLSIKNGPPAEHLALDLALDLAEAAVESHFSAAAARYRRRTQQGFWAVCKNRERSHVVEMLGSRRFAEILDIGCGGGSYLDILKTVSRGRITLVDLSKNMLASIPEVGAEVTLRHGNFAGLEFDKKFDLILCLGVLEFVSEPAEFMVKMAKHLAPKGRVLLLFPVSRAVNRLYQLYHASHGIEAKLFTVTAVERLAASAGFHLKNQKFPLPLNCLMELALD